MERQKANTAASYTLQAASKGKSSKPNAREIFHV
jgi:hypothetical protein